MTLAPPRSRPPQSSAQRPHRETASWPTGAPPRRRPWLVLAVVASLGAHAAFVAALYLARREEPPPPATPVMTVALVPDAPAANIPTAALAPAPAAAGPPPRPRAFRSRPPRPSARVIVAATAPATTTDGDGVSDAALAGAAGVGAGGGGGGACDMLRSLETALRGDRRVQAAVAPERLGGGAGRKALMVWNGDWVTSGSEDGKGLSTVREAILWEVAFAPKACREQRVHGLVVISLADAPGVAKLVIGQQDWRWADLLTAR